MAAQPELTPVPPQLRRLLARCFETDPRRRLRDIGHVRVLLDDPVERHAVAAAAPA